MLWRDVRPGQQPTSRQMNDLAAAALRTVIGPDGVAATSGPDGTFLLPPPSPVIDALTVGSASGADHAWKEQICVAGAWADLADGRSGTTSVLPARERGGASVAAGTRIELLLDASEEFYSFDAPASSTPSGVALAEADGTPSYSAVTSITFDQADGFVLAQPGGAGTARIDLAPASTTQAGIIDTSAQTLAGAKHIPSGSKIYNATGGHTEYAQWAVSEFGSTLNAQIDMYSSASDYRGTFGGHYYVTTNSLWFELADSVVSPASEVFYAVRKAGVLYSGKTGTDPVGNVITSGIVTTIGAAATGTVTSVGLSLPAIFTTSGSPVTSSGTLTAVLATQSANLVFAGPAAGGAAAPTFRALEAADLPAQAGGWVTITLSYANFSTGSTTHIYTPSTLPAKTVVHAVVVRTTTAFSGGAIGAYNLDVGLASGSGTEWCSGYDVMAAPSGTNFNFHPGSGATGVLPALLNPVSGVNLAITANCTGANLNAATQGTVEVSLFLSRLP